MRKNNCERMKSYYLKKAEENLPVLNKSQIRPNVHPYVISGGESVTIDLGNHYVGRFSFKMWYTDEYIDAPVRMEVRFLECERELADDYSEFNSGLCRSWLQDEIINVDFPGVYSKPAELFPVTDYIKIIGRTGPEIAVIRTGFAVFQKFFHFHIPFQILRHTDFLLKTFNHTVVA